jgi:hypothetical protein
VLRGSSEFRFAPVDLRRWVLWTSDAFLTSVEGSFGVWTRADRSQMTFWEVLKRSGGRQRVLRGLEAVQWFANGFLAGLGRVPEACREALRSLEACRGRIDEFGGFGCGQMELGRLSKRAKGMRGYQFVSPRCGSSGVEHREG